MTAAFKLPPLAAIARETGELILAMQADIVAQKDWKLKEDGSPVSPADKAAHALVTARLKKEFPGVAIVSEEAEEADNEKALQAADRFETDPLDNTSGYVHGGDTFSVNIGRIQNGVPVVGAVYFPARKELFFTGDDGKAYLQKGDVEPQEISVRKGPLADPVRVASGYNKTSFEHLAGRTIKILKYAAQYRTCMIAAGDCDISGISGGGRGHYESWDLAGPHAVLRAAGGEMVSRDGTPITYGTNTELPNPIAGSRAALAELGLLKGPKAEAPKPLKTKGPKPRL
jgi:3'(2'), 5'-bisphosphate nucleotidase